MTAKKNEQEVENSLPERLVKVLISIIVLAWVTVLVGYGGWTVLTISATVGGPDPRTEDGDRLRDKLLS